MLVSVKGRECVRVFLRNCHIRMCVEARAAADACKVRNSRSWLPALSSSCTLQASGRPSPEPEVERMFPSCDYLELLSPTVDLIPHWIILVEVATLETQGGFGWMQLICGGDAQGSVSPHVPRVWVLRPALVRPSASHCICFAWSSLRASFSFPSHWIVRSFPSEEGFRFSALECITSCFTSINSFTVHDLNFGFWLSCPNFEL